MRFWAASFIALHSVSGQKSSGIVPLFSFFCFLNFSLYFCFYTNTVCALVCVSILRVLYVLCSPLSVGPLLIRKLRGVKSIPIRCLLRLYIFLCVLTPSRGWGEVVLGQLVCVFCCCKACLNPTHKSNFVLAVVSLVGPAHFLSLGLHYRH